MICPLCENMKTQPLSKSLNYHFCPQCDLRFLDSSRRLNAEDEKKRYLTHNNDTNDSRYRDFVKPLVDEITARNPVGKIGLDYGAGAGPVTAAILKEMGYNVSLYDPYFWDDITLLKENYDFIYSCEVVEHFYNPKLEFNRLHKLLKPGGSLSIMTQLYDHSIDFENWYYKKDPTHVVFYSKATFNWILKFYNFDSLQITGSRLITLLKA
jgi:SAM-dependent methyltransferase